MTRISIIVPCYNLGDYLKPCLNGISKQEVGEAEYIFINDGSSDDTLIRLNEFCENRTYCKVLNQPNSGVSAARNAALSIAKGEYIYLLDGDDILTDDALRNMLAAIRNSDCDAVISEACVLKNGVEKKIPLPLPDGIYTPKEIYETAKVFPIMPQLLYRTEIIRSHNLRFDGNLRYGEVYEFTIRFFCFSKRIKVISECFFKYVMRDDSATHAPNFSKDLTIIHTLEKYNRVGIQFASLSSFKLTAYKMIMAFTYNKYVKLGLTSDEAINNIRELITDSGIKKLIKEISTSSGVPIKDRLLAYYVSLTGVHGYKLLAKFLRLI